VTTPNSTLTPSRPEIHDHLAIDEGAAARLFTEARSAHAFTDEPVTAEQLRAIYDLAKFPPTAANTNPLRIVFVDSPHARARLVDHMAEGNRARVAQAPAVAVLAADLDFHEQIPTLFPDRAEMKGRFAADEELRERTARFNATLQVGYFLMAVRAAGLAAAPMAGFDAAGIERELFANGRRRVLLVVPIGHADEPRFERLPRLDYDQAVSHV
jgi:3-hydroxypropanoate dehydrogenase